MSEQGLRLYVENGNSSASTTVMRRAACELNWPTIKEMESVLNCVYCNCIPFYPIMQCAAGHIICKDEGQRLESCPCGAPLFQLRLRWYKWMIELASYACPIKDCTETLVGQKDRGNHILLSHESEELFRRRSSIHNDAKDSPEEARLSGMFHLTTIEENLKNKRTDIIGEAGAASSEFLQPKRPRTASTSTAKDSVSTTVIIAGFDCETVLRDSEIQLPVQNATFSVEGVGYPVPRQYDAYDEMMGVGKAGRDVVLQYQYSRTNRKSRKFIKPKANNDKKDDKNEQGKDDISEENMYGYGAVSEEELGDLFRLSKDEERMYYMKKWAIDQQPGHWSKIIRGDRRKIPLSAIFRELRIIKARADRGKPYKRDRRCPSPFYREESTWLDDV